MDRCNSATAAMTCCAIYKTFTKTTCGLNRVAAAAEVKVYSRNENTAK